MRIRKYNDSDINEIVNLFYETVHSVNKRDYTKKQLNAWALKSELEDKLKSWNKSFNTNITYVVEIRSDIVGFSDMTHSGYIDRLYTHKDFQGKGIATMLLNKLESIAMSVGISEIYTAASVTAKSFFEKNGYGIIMQQNVERNGVFLSNFKMHKSML